MIGISCPSLSFYRLGDALEMVRRNFRLWEIVAELEHALPETEAEISYAQDSYDMSFQVHAPIADLNIGSPSERFRRHSMNELLSVMESCERLGIGLLTVHPGAAIAYGDALKPTVREATKASLSELDRRLRDMHLKVALENMPPAVWSIGYDADELRSMIADTSIGICLDVGHAHLAGTLETFLSRDCPIINVHLHNNNGSYDEHLPLEQGTLDMRSALSAVQRVYAGSYILEARNIEEGILSKALLESMLGNGARTG